MGTPKALRVTAGCETILVAGRYVGCFNVLRAQQWTCVRDALEWLGHEVFVPHPPSLEASITFYYKLFTGQRADVAAALAWDAANSMGRDFVFCAWEDKHKQHYIVHDDGKQPWTFPQEQPRVPVTASFRHFAFFPQDISL